MMLLFILGRQFSALEHNAWIVADCPENGIWQIGKIAEKTFQMVVLSLCVLPHNFKYIYLFFDPF